MGVVRIVAVAAMAIGVSGCTGLLGFLQGDRPEEAREAEAPAEVEQRDPAAGASIVATMRVVRARRFLPADLETRDLALRIEQPMGIEQLAGRLADVLAVNVAVEDRPARDGVPVELGEAVPVEVDESGKVREVLDGLALRLGYEWEYVGAAAPPRIVFFRHIDAGWRDRLARAVREEPDRPLDVWRIEPARHETLKGVLEDWAELAGWTVVWEAEDLDYAVTARAVFHGTFEEAVDGLLRDTRGYRTLIPTAWRANRYLTVRVGG